MTTESQAQETAEAGTRSGGFKVWHLTLLVAFVALAIREIQVEHVTDPILIAIAAGGFAAYGVLAWLGWRTARRFETRLGRVALLGVYYAGMAGLFFVATVIFLLIESLYRGGRF